MERLFTAIQESGFGPGQWQENNFFSAFLFHAFNDTFHAYAMSIFDMICEEREMEGSAEEYELFYNLCVDFARGLYTDSSAEKLYKMCEVNLCEAYRQMWTF